MNVQDMIEVELKRVGADGLVNVDGEDGLGCGCSVGDLAPCGAPCLTCLPATKRILGHGEFFDFAGPGDEIYTAINDAGCEHGDTGD